MYVLKKLSKNVTVKKPWDVDNVEVWLLQDFEHRKVLSKNVDCEEILQANKEKQLKMK